MTMTEPREKKVLVELNHDLSDRVDAVADLMPVEYTSKKHFVNVAVKRLLEIEEAKSKTTSSA